MCASQQDTGEERQSPEPQPAALSPPEPQPAALSPPEPQPDALSPPEPQPDALSPLHSRRPRRSYIQLTLRAPRRPQADDAPLPGKDPLPASESPAASEPSTASETSTASEPAASDPETASEPPTASEPTARELLSVGRPQTTSEPQTVSKPPTADSPPANDPPQQVAQAPTSGNASAGMYATRLLDASMIVIGVALFLSALATLTSTWAWSWHASSGATFTLSGIHGICTSAMGELAQGASGAVATNCLWVDLTWTEAIGLTGGGCILAAIGVARIVRALRTPA